MQHSGRSAMVRSVWIVRQQEDFPRLVSCYSLVTTHAAAFSWSGKYVKFPRHPPSPGRV
ncbi:MAG: DUF6883 domain-containing protein [Acidithiobacillus sp.]